MGDRVRIVSGFDFDDDYAFEHKLLEWNGRCYTNKGTVTQLELDAHGGYLVRIDGQGRSFGFGTTEVEPLNRYDHLVEDR